MGLRGGGGAAGGGAGGGGGGGGGFIGYRIGIKNKVSQSQKAGNNSNQTQIGSITNHGNTESR